jgi:hypothetical protein
MAFLAAMHVVLFFFCFFPPLSFSQSILKNSTSHYSECVVWSVITSQIVLKFKKLVLVCKMEYLVTLHEDVSRSGGTGFVLTKEFLLDRESGCFACSVFCLLRVYAIFF